MLIPRELRTIADGLFHDHFALDHQRRLAAYRHYWLFYLGKHWSYQRDPGEPTITLNYCRRVLDILNDFTFKKGFKSTIPDDPTTPENEREDREFIRVMLDETWRRNLGALWMLDAAQQGGVTGDLFLRVSWEVKDPLENPYAKVDVIPSHLVFPEFAGPQGVQRKTLRRVLIMNPVFEEVESKRVQLTPRAIYQGAQRNTSVDLVIYSEEWKAAEYDKFGNLQSPATVTYWRDQEKMGEPILNPIGEIPVVHISNYPLSGEFYGISDLVDSAEINREMNEKITDISDIINYHASPVTIITGAKIKDLERGANRVWALPPGASATNLTLTGDLTAAVSHWKQLKESLLELTGVPEQALGKLQAISNTSGVALSIQYLPLVMKRDIKVLTYGIGLRLVNRLIMKVTAIGDPSFGAKFDTLGRNKYRNEVIFPDPMPFDEAAELEKARAKIDLGLSSKRIELEKMGYSQAEVVAILKEAIAEQEKEADALFQVSGRGVAQNMRGGVPEVRAQKVSATVAAKQNLKVP